jgi:hypothetical protein
MGRSRNGRRIKKEGIKMKRKTYRATIINNGHTSIMLVGGYNKPSVKKQLN